MNPLGILKLGVDVVVSAGVGGIIGAIVKNNIVVPDKNFAKITTAVSVWVLGNAVGNFVANATNEQIDQTVDQVKDVRNTYKAFKSAK